VEECRGNKQKIGRSNVRFAATGKTQTTRAFTEVKKVGSLLDSFNENTTT
jgi:hypothetical protein